MSKKPKPKFEKVVKQRTKRPKTKLHEGKSFGLCKKCGEQFRLKRKTKHKKGVIKGVICSKCGSKSR